jgi:hypothetical protein
MAYTKSQAMADKRYKQKNREKINLKHREYSKNHYYKNADSIREKNLNRYHFKQQLKILLDDVPTPPPVTHVVSCH